MPVYNGERTISEAVQSLLNQTEGDFLLRISDNGSSDGTPAIAKDLAGSDKRIRYVRHEINRGAAWNFNYLVESTMSPLVIWAAHDDLWDPPFLERCLAQLQQSPQAVLAFSKEREMDADGKVFRTDVRPPQDVASDRIAARIGGVFRTRTYSHIYGLIRRSALLQTRLVRPVWGPDVHLLLELSFLGPATIVPETLFSKRVYRELRDRDRASSITGSSFGERKLALCHSKLLLDLLRGVAAAPMPLTAKCESVGAALAAIYEPDTPLRGAALSELAAGMRASFEGRHVAQLAWYTVARSLLDPRTPLECFRKTGGHCRVSAVLS
ncbi:MAG: glycosyltransferase family 2 protein [Acidimicrobiales bacterium]